jgi:hypothetical protein
VGFPTPIINKAAKIPLFFIVNKEVSKKIILNTLRKRGVKNAIFERSSKKPVKEC